MMNRLIDEKKDDLTLFSSMDNTTEMCTRYIMSSIFWIGLACTVWLFRLTENDLAKQF